MRARAASALGEVRARPRHVLLYALLTGLLLGPLGGPVALGGAAGAAALGGRPALALAASGAEALGVLVARARASALARTDLRPLIGRPVNRRATLLEPPRAHTFTRTALARLGPGPGQGEKVVLEAPLRLGWSAREEGAEVRASGTLRALEPWEDYLRRRGAHAALLARDLRATGRRRGGLAGAIDAVRRRAERALTLRLAAREGALLRGMVLGEDDALPDGTRADFRAAGLTHIVAASGQNVLLLSALALPLMAWLGVALRARLLVLLALTVLYVPLAGSGPSIQRAGVMGACGVLATLAGRPGSRAYALGLAATVTLVLSPAVAGDAGWQLSFAAVISIVALAPRFHRALIARRLPRPFAEGAALTLAATLGTAPLIAFHFGRLSLVSLPVNVLAAPVVAVVMWIGMAAALAGQALPALGGVLALPAAPGLGFLEWLAHTGTGLPHATTSVHLGSPLALAGLYALLAALVLARRGIRRGLTAAAAAAAALAAAWPAVAPAAGLPPGALRISFLDIGQGDATLVQQDGHAVLVDAGPPDGPVLARLKAAHVGALDLAVVTHDQADHEGGMPAVLAHHRVGLLLDGADGSPTAEHRVLLAAAGAAGVRRAAPTAGQEIRAGPLRLRVRWPPAEPYALHREEDPNARAIVSELDDGPFRLLLTADAESDVTGGLPLAPVTVLKVAHHGSADPGLPDLLRRLRPAVAVIEVGRHNPYGHPTAQALRALRVVPHVLRTDRDGTVTLTVLGGRMTLATTR